MALPFRVEEKVKAYHQIMIKDNGIGFDQEDADRIFNAFTHIHCMAVYKVSGVGLPLFIK
jgi:signal transduction histidine kinase